MFTPDSYLYETNLALLSTLSEEELADVELVAAIIAGPTPLAALGSWLFATVRRGLAGLAAAFVYTPADGELGVEYWLHPPLY